MGVAHDIHEAVVPVSETVFVRAQHQGAIDVLTNRPAKSQAGGVRGILECKSVSSLPMLGSDKHGFRNWNDRLVNIVSNIRPGSRKILRAMMEFVDQEGTGDFYEDWKEQQESGEMEAAGTPYAQRCLTLRA